MNASRFQSVAVYPHGFAAQLGLPVLPGAPIIHVTGCAPDDHFALYGGRWVRTTDLSPALSGDIKGLEAVVFARPFHV